MEGEKGSKRKSQEERRNFQKKGSSLFSMSLGQKEIKAKKKKENIRSNKDR